MHEHVMSRVISEVTAIDKTQNHIGDQNQIVKAFTTKKYVELGVFEESIGSIKGISGGLGLNQSGILIFILNLNTKNKWYELD